MARFCKLKISGLRSFNPDSEEDSLLKVDQPLTIVVGPNGTGKSTLIECFKYATTGETPVGPTKKHLFVHEPSTLRREVVNASLALEFDDAQRRKCTVYRALQTRMKKTKKKTTMECRSEESTLTFRTPNGDKVQTSNKIQDVNTEVAKLLGVPQPILSYVTFCHQDDANWPMSDPKTLKEKFDAIFDSTKYINLQKEVNDIRKEKEDEVRLIDKDLKFFQYEKDEAKLRRRELNEKVNEQRRLTGEIGRIKVQLEPLEADLAEILNEAQTFQAMKEQNAALDADIRNYETNIARYKCDNIKPYPGPLEECEKLLDNFNENLQPKKDMISKLDIKLDTLEAEEVNQSESIDRLKDKIARVDAETKIYNDKVGERNEKVEGYVTELNIEGVQGPFTSHTHRKFRQKLNGLTIESTGALKKCQEDRAKELEVFRKRDRELRNEIASLNERKRGKEESLTEKQSTLSDIRHRLTNLSSSQNRLKQAELIVSKIDREVKDKQTEVDEKETEKEIQHLTMEKEEKKAQIEELEEDLSKGQATVSERSKLGFINDELSEKEAERDVLLDDNARSLLFDLLQIQFDPDDPSIRRHLVKFLASVSNDRRLAEDEKDMKNNLLLCAGIDESSAKDRLSALNDELKEKEKFLKKELVVMQLYIFYANLKEWKGGEDVNEALERLNQSVTDLQMGKGKAEGERFVFSQYQDAMKTNPSGHQCPLCHSKCTAKTFQILQKTVSERLGTILTPEESDVKIAELTERREMLEKIKMESDKKKVLAEKIRSIEKERDAAKKNVSKCQRDVDKKTAELESCKQKCKQVEGLIQKFGNWEPLVSKIASLKAETDKIRTKLGSSVRYDVPGLLEKIRRIKVEKEACECDVERKRIRLQSYHGEITALQQKRIQAQKEVLEIGETLQQKDGLHLKCKDLEKDILRAKSDISEASDLLIPLEEELNDIEEKCEDCNEKSMVEIGALQENSYRLNVIVSEYARITYEITAFEESGRLDELERLRNENNYAQQSLVEVRNRRKDVQHQIQQLKDSMKDEDGQKRALQDAYDYKIIEQKLAEAETKMDQNMNMLGQWADVDIDSEQQTIQTKITQFSRECHGYQGQLKEIEGTIERLEGELRQEKYASANENYRKALIKQVTLEKLAEDLVKYKQALDMAIIEFHRMKMIEINETLSELWHDVYDKKDIEDIMISTEDDEGQVLSGSGMRRSYNYSVKKLEKNVWSDMRHMSSAGQKVLASVLIRVALSEVFSSHCGMLALDEPTTNLDESHIENLASALGELVQRKKHTNFQLLLITHDPHFAKLMMHRFQPEWFYHVGKDEDGFSRLRYDENLAYFKKD